MGSPRKSADGVDPKILASREYARFLYKKNREHILDRIKERRKENPEPFKINNRRGMKALRERNPEWQAATNKKNYSRHREKRLVSAKEYLKRRRLEVITRYGGKCACCGEDRIEFLSIDHVHGGGTKHRKEVGKGSSFYAWIIRNNFPKDLRILCHNCNQSLGYNKYCPHNKDFR